MTKSNILFIGMDVHKESIEIAIADDGANGEVRRYGRIGGTLDALKKTLRKLVSENKTLHFCYEAGPCGYGLYRYLTDEGHVCIVVAPSLIPKKPGDEVKRERCRYSGWQSIISPYVRRSGASKTIQSDLIHPALG